MSFTPFNAPLLGPLFGDREIAGHFSVEADVRAMRRFEAALAEAEAEAGVIPPEAAEAIVAACLSFEPDIGSLGRAVARDGVAVPDFVRQLRQAVGEPHQRHVHFGATSQDVVDTSLVLRLRDVNATLVQRIEGLEGLLAGLVERHGGNRLTGRTRMQAAIPITAAHRIGAWMHPLADHRARLHEMSPRLLAVQFGGAAGTLDALGDAGTAVTQGLADRLHLGAPARVGHTDRARIVAYGDWLSLVAGTLGKFGQDVALMAQTGIGEIALSGGGGSSAMPHKSNPVLAETLVTLARFNATLVSGLHHALVHEQERSGAAWALEWLILPQMAVATGAALRNAARLAEGVVGIGDGAARP